MKAIAKYLPVEGEIKEGDKVMFPNGIIADMLSGTEVNGKLGYSIDAAQGVKKAKEALDSFIGQEKKLKLFAVTHDIEVGDEVISKINGRKSTIKVDQEIEILKDICFKVLGELSPKAIWVNEGDVIKIEDQDGTLIYWHITEDGRRQTWTFGAPLESNKYLRVLGPCGHYH